MAMHKEKLSHIISQDLYNNLVLNPHENSEVLLDPALDYLSQFLLEEDGDDDISGHQEAALRDMEKPFYDILGERYPPLPDNQLLSQQSRVIPDYTISVLKDQVGPSYSESLATEFQRGVEEGLKFLPNHNRLSIKLQESNFSLDPIKKRGSNNSLDTRSEEEKESNLLNKSKGKNRSNDSDKDLLEGQNRKIPMFSHEETIRDEMFDEVLLDHGENYAHEEIPELNANACSENQNHYNNINLKALLISCAQEVSINNIKSTKHLIKQIRMQASPIGDAVQRLSWILADGLEARLTGTGSETYRRFVTKRLSATDILKVYRMFMKSSNNLRVPYHFANESILSAAGTASKIHVIDFGISFGFQWPSLIQALAKRKGGPPTLRITGVDLPQPGFHPAERIKETGKRLEVYARGFGVPLEYHGIAAQWESICIEDLCINNDEVLIVNSLYNLTRQRDEPLFDMNMSRNQLLNLIRDIKPKVFIQGVFNFSFSPFFIPRFRMVFSQYLRFFDMHDTSFPRNSKSVLLMEREVLGPTIINQIACEGSDLVAGPENYKQWHVRILQTGFEQLPIDPRVMKECSEMVGNGFNKGHFIEEDCSWFLQGWKGNIIYAVSLWKPKVG